MKKVRPKWVDTEAIVNAVDANLLSLKYFHRWGYVYTDEQKDKLSELCRIIVKGEEDGTK